MRWLAGHLLARLERTSDPTQRLALDDDFASFLSEASLLPSDGNSHRYYHLAPKRVIHIAASVSMISAGTTGFSLWEASVAMLAALMAPSTELRQLFAGRRVLELGSGTGLGGIAVAALTAAKSVLLTDIERVLDAYTVDNIARNVALFPSDTVVASSVLHWDDDATLKQLGRTHDILLGCDVVYDPELNNLLFDALMALLLSTASTIQHAVLMCTVRNPPTFYDFVARLETVLVVDARPVATLVGHDGEIHREILLVNPTSIHRLILTRRQ